MIYVIIMTVIVLPLLMFLNWFLKDALKFIQQEPEQIINTVKDKTDV